MRLYGTFNPYGIHFNRNNFIHLKNFKELFLRSDERIDLFAPHMVAKYNARLFYCETKIN